jgi:ribonuclease D
VDRPHARPSSIEELSQIEGLAAGLIRRSGDRILAAIAAAASDETDYSPPLSPDESQKSLLKLMQSLVAECASELELAAETVASKRELNSIISSGGVKSKVLSGWRREVIGERLLSLL